MNTIEKLAKGLSNHPSVANALKRANEEITTDEASGHEGQDEAHAHVIKLSGDFSPENPVTDADAETIKQLILKRTEGVLVDVTPAEGAYDSVVIHSMHPKQSFIDILDDMVDESAAVPYTDELSENKK
ncbi:hypothetical protein EB001_17585 [bacterium]|nr:hypothetical protein [bacterium]